MNVQEFKHYLRLIFCINTSYRRYADNKFYTDHAINWDKNAVCIDVGGKKKKKKGEFRIEEYITCPIFVNVDPNVCPDYVCNAESMPFDDDFADMVICSEMLEHVENVDGVINEIYRILKKGGIAYICVPFSVHIHAAPYDFGRYTDTFLNKHFTECGFQILESESQGGYWATKLNMDKKFLKILFKRYKYNPLLLFLYLLVLCQDLVQVKMRFSSS